MTAAIEIDEAERAPTVALTERTVTVALTETQDAWLRRRAADQSPPVAPGEALRRILDEAIAASRATAERRARQLEVYRASGYPEHHPDYPSRYLPPS